MVEATAWLYVLVVFVAAALLFLTTYAVITLADLESDYINCTECCKRMNQVLLPELVLLCTMVVGFLLFQQWLAMAINVPLVAFLGNRYMAASSSSSGFFDPTEMFQSGTLQRHQREAFAKLAIYLFSFFAYLYMMMLWLLTDEMVMQVPE